MDIYIKPAKKVTIAERTQILIKDIADVVASKDVADGVKELKLMDINAGSKTNLLISVTDIIKVINGAYPEHTVNNVGEMDTVIDYAPKKSVDNPVFKWLKVVFVIIILLFGSSTAIMSFHTDAEIPKVFARYYEIFFNKQNDKPLIIDIPYSLGLAAGIIVFFNHFAGKKITDDPTPIEVEMSLYENDVTDTVLDMLDTQRLREKEKKGGGEV